MNKDKDYTSDNSLPCKAQAEQLADALQTSIKEALDNRFVWRIVKDLSLSMKQQILSQIDPDAVIFLSFRYPWFRHEYQGLSELGYLSIKDKHLFYNGQNNLSVIAQYFWYREWQWCITQCKEADIDWNIIRTAFGLEKTVRLSQRANGKAECKEYKMLRRKLDKWLIFHPEA